MESAKTYITYRLSSLVVDFPELKVLYKYDALSKEHLVKILPLDGYNNNDFKNTEEEITLNFIEKYPYDSIVFLTEGDWIDIDKPDKIFEGKIYYFSIIYRYNNK